MTSYIFSHDSQYVFVIQLWELFVYCKYWPYSYIQFANTFPVYNYILFYSLCLLAHRGFKLWYCVIFVSLWPDSWPKTLREEDYILHFEKCRSLQLEAPDTEEQFMWWCPGSREKEGIRKGPRKGRDIKNIPPVPTSHRSSLSVMPCIIIFKAPICWVNQRPPIQQPVETPSETCSGVLY